MISIRITVLFDVWSNNSALLESIIVLLFVPLSIELFDRFFDIKFARGESEKVTYMRQCQKSFFEQQSECFEWFSFVWKSSINNVRAKNQSKIDAKSLSPFVDMFFTKFGSQNAPKLIQNRVASRFWLLIWFQNAVGVGRRQPGALRSHPGDSFGRGWGNLFRKENNQN